MNYSNAAEQLIWKNYLKCLSYLTRDFIQLRSISALSRESFAQKAIEMFSSNVADKLGATLVNHDQCDLSGNFVVLDGKGFFSCGVSAFVVIGHIQSALGDKVLFIHDPINHDEIRLLGGKLKVNNVSWESHLASRGHSFNPNITPTNCVDPFGSFYFQLLNAICGRFSHVCESRNKQQTHMRNVLCLLEEICPLLTKRVNIVTNTR